MRLFVDDIREPTFVKRWGEYYDTIARTSKQAIDVLEEYYAENSNRQLVIYLDHDLGGDDTTMPVVMWLAEAAFDGRVNPERVSCIIHTQNPVGRENIKMTLKRWGFSPVHVYI